MPAGERRESPFVSGGIQAVARHNGQLAAGAAFAEAPEAFFQAGSPPVEGASCRKRRI